MGKRVRSIIFLYFIFGFPILAFGQFTSEYPPEPILAEGPSRSGCGETDGETGTGIPPPVGLCLPINDYLFPLFISGVALGAFSLFNLQQKAGFKDSVG